MSGRERRRHRRYEVEGLDGRLDGRYDCTIVKLSRGGMLATALVEPAPDQRMVAEIFLDGEVFRSSGRVAFVGPDTSAPREHRSRIGIEFLETPTASQRRLDRFIHERLESDVSPS